MAWNRNYSTPPIYSPLQEQLANTYLIQQTQATCIYVENQVHLIHLKIFTFRLFPLLPLGCLVCVSKA